MESYQKSMLEYEAECSPDDPDHVAAVASRLIKGIGGLSTTSSMRDEIDEILQVAFAAAYKCWKQP